MTTEGPREVDAGILDEEFDLEAEGGTRAATPVGGKDLSASPEAPKDANTPQEGDGQDAGEEGAHEPLPDYKADDPAVLDAYDAHFFTEEGELDTATLTAEWDANDASGTGEQGSLSEGTYAYLKDRLGLSKEKVKEIEAGQVALRKQEIASTFDRIGGRGAYLEALAWAKGEAEGSTAGYSEAERKRFNAKVKAGGADRDEALDALMARHARATGKVPAGATPRRGPPLPRAANAPREVGKTSGTTARGDVFADNTEYLAARAEARKAANPKEALAAVEAKLTRSTFWRSKG